LPAVSRAVILGTMTSVLAATYVYRFERFSRGVFLIDAVLLVLAILGSRLSFRMMAHAAVMQSTRARRVLICGAGERGRLLAREMLANTSWHMKPVGFIDSGETSEHSLLGVRVVGKIDDLKEVLERLRVDEAVFSGDPIDPAQRQRAQRTCADVGVVVRDLIFEMRETGRNVHGSSVA
jgi:UDP-GlcNAc:undecaprenyl-phosphate GlcNAc-1-phosphate transferase